MTSPAQLPEKATPTSSAHLDPSPEPHTDISVIPPHSASTGKASFLRPTWTKGAFVAVIGLLALGTAGLKLFVGNTPVPNATVAAESQQGTHDEDTQGQSPPVPKPAPDDAVVVSASTRDTPVVDEPKETTPPPVTPAIPEIFPAVNVEASQVQNATPVPVIATPEIKPAPPIDVPSFTEPKPSSEPQRLPSNIVSTESAPTAKVHVPDAVVVPIPTAPAPPSGSGLQVATPPNIVVDVPTVMAVDAKGVTKPNIPAVPTVPDVSKIPAVPTAPKTVGLSEPGGLVIPSITPTQKDAEKPVPTVQPPKIADVSRTHGIPTAPSPGTVPQNPAVPVIDMPNLPKPTSGVTVPSPTNVAIPSTEKVSATPPVPAVMAVDTKPPIPAPLTPAPAKIKVDPISPPIQENKASAGTPVNIQPVSLPESPAPVPVPAPIPAPRTGQPKKSGNTSLVKDVPQGDDSVKTPVPERPKEIAQVGNVAPPRTDYDVDLHAPRAGESFEAISRQHYGDAKYSEALRAFNAGRTPGSGTSIQIPPIYVLRKQFPQMLDVNRTAPSVYPNAPTSPPSQFAPGRTSERNNRTADVQWAPVANGNRSGTYRVPRSGMKLWDIAEEVYGDRRDWQRVWRANPQLDPNSVLTPGTQIRIP